MVMGKDAAVGFLGLFVGIVGCAGPRIRDASAVQPITRMSSAGSGASAPPTGPAPKPAADFSATRPLQQASQNAPMRIEGTAENVSAAPQPSSGDPMDQLRAMHRRATERWAAMDSYICRLRRREQVNGKDRPEEVLVCRFRKQPFSVYFKCLGPEGRGREVTYVSGQHGNQIHSLLAAGDMPFAPAGKRVDIAPDSIFVRSASRHGITEAGFGDCIERFGKRLDALASGDTRGGTIKYLGLVKRPEYDTPLEATECDLAPGHDPNLPRGGRRWLMFDPASRMPVLVITQDETGHEVEYYCYDRIEWPVKLDDDDFNPDKLWPAK
jgi:hypothetical protein